MVSLKGKTGLQTVGSSKNLLFTYLIYPLPVIPDYAKFMSVAFISYTIKKLIEYTDAMYAHLHVQKCKRPLNELFHALSKSLSTRLVLYSHLTLVHRAAALATGCQVSIEYKLGSAFDIRQNKALGTPHKYFTKN